MRLLPKLLFWTFFVVGTLSSVGLYVLQNNHDLRHMFFKNCCITMNNSLPPEMKAKRCTIVKDLTGTVVEIGPGPGTGLECLKNYSRPLKEWRGVEPNPHFAEVLREKAANLSLGFPVKFTQSYAEDMTDIPSNSVDYVMSMHTLCSVQSVDKVLKEIARILKPGGAFVFMEHVSGAEGTWTLSVQKTILPVWKIIGDGCDFRNTGEDLRRVLGSSFDMEFEAIEIDSPLFFVRPHIIGRVVKRS